MKPTLLLIALASLLAVPAGARTITLDHTTTGAAFDGLLDGFPGLAPRDGTADFGGNPLSVVRKGEVTELRAIMEFPLATVDATAAEITSATLRFNVDDVLATLGPGTELNGKAASSILVHPFDGDGTVTLADYKRTGEPATTVDIPGSITDASLNQSGALFFTVDVSEHLRQALSAGTPFLGILWRTNDSPTGTSLDDGRGGSASGEASDTSAGSHMPQLIIEISATPPPDPVCGNGTLETGESCDDGAACTTTDICVEGACVGQPSCGNGALDATCAEECDDGNLSAADGCSAACRYDSLPGGTTVKECLLAFALAQPTRAATGALATEERCVDGDPCDTDPAAGVCGFDVAVCLGQLDARVPGCQTPAEVAGSVAGPSRGAAGTSKRDLQAALAAVAPGHCSAPVRVSVAVRGKRVQREGKRKLAATARGAARQRDRDVLVLRCVPHS